LHTHWCMIFHLLESIVVCVEKHMWNIPDMDARI
jgi:hypothetical protein